MTTSNKRLYILAAVLGVLALSLIGYAIYSAKTAQDDELRRAVATSVARDCTDRFLTNSQQIVDVDVDRQVFLALAKRTNTQDVTNVLKAAAVAKEKILKQIPLPNCKNEINALKKLGIEIPPNAVKVMKATKPSGKVDLTQIIIPPKVDPNTGTVTQPRTRPSRPNPRLIRPTTPSPSTIQPESPSAPSTPDPAGPSGSVTTTTTTVVAPPVVAPPTTTTVPGTPIIPGPTPIIDPPAGSPLPTINLPPVTLPPLPTIPSLPDLLDPILREPILPQLLPTN